MAIAPIAPLLMGPGSAGAGRRRATWRSASWGSRAIYRAAAGGYLLVPRGPLDRAQIGALLLGARVLTEERR